jgi:arylsulfatase A-like enzyme
MAFYDAARESRFQEAGSFHLLALLERFFRRGSWAAPTIDAAVGWLRRHRNEAFFLWVHLIDPHFPYDPPPPYDRSFGDPDEDYTGLLAALRRGELDIDAITGGVSLPSDVRETGTALYDGEILYTDRQLGRLLDALEDLGIRDRTLVVVTSDHGEGLGEHGVIFEHGLNTHEELMHVPLLFVWPGRVTAGRRVSTQVSTLDIAPTILDLLNVPPSSTMRGTSLAPVLGGSSDSWDARPAYGENQPLQPGHPTYSAVARYPGIFRPGNEGKWRMVRLSPWKLIHVPGRPQGENLLFNLELDPQEERDMAAARPEVLSTLLAHLEGFLAEDSDHVEREPDTPLREEDLEQLRALGYVE